jgi:hypothetical protein
MSGALVELLINSASDRWFTYQPQVTFFKKVFRRHTQFSKEFIEKNIDIDFGNLVRIKIPKKGNLVHRMFIEITLPELETIYPNTREYDIQQYIKSAKCSTTLRNKFRTCFAPTTDPNKPYLDYLALYNILDDQHQNHFIEYIDSVLDDTERDYDLRSITSIFEDFRNKFSQELFGGIRFDPDIINKTILKTIQDYDIAVGINQSLRTTVPIIITKIIGMPAVVDPGMKRLFVENLGKIATIPQIANTIEQFFSSYAIYYDQLFERYTDLFTDESKWTLNNNANIGNIYAYILPDISNNTFNTNIWYFYTFYYLNRLNSNSLANYLVSNMQLTSAGSNLVINMLNVLQINLEYYMFQTSYDLNDLYLLYQNNLKIYSTGYASGNPSRAITFIAHRSHIPSIQEMFQYIDLFLSNCEITYLEKITDMNLAVDIREVNVIRDILKRLYSTIEKMFFDKAVNESPLIINYVNWFVLGNTPIDNQITISDKLSLIRFTCAADKLNRDIQNSFYQKISGDNPYIMFTPKYYTTDNIQRYDGLPYNLTSYQSRTGSIALAPIPAPNQADYKYGVNPNYYRHDFNISVSDYNISNTSVLPLGINTIDWYNLDHSIFAVEQPSIYRPVVDAIIIRDRLAKLENVTDQLNEWAIENNIVYTTNKVMEEITEWLKSYQITWQDLLGDIDNIYQARELFLKRYIYYVNNRANIDKIWNLLPAINGIYNLMEYLADNLKQPYIDWLLPEGKFDNIQDWDKYILLRLSPWFNPDNNTAYDTMTLLNFKYNAIQRLQELINSSTRKLITKSILKRNDPKQLLFNQVPEYYYYWELLTEKDLEYLNNSDYLDPINQIEYNPNYEGKVRELVDTIKIDDDTVVIKDIRDKLAQVISRDRVPRFAWIEKLAHFLVETVQIESDNKILDTHTSYWLESLSELFRDDNKIIGYDRMIGNVPLMYNFNTKSKPEYTIYLPLQFYFNRSIGASLPLIATRDDYWLTIRLRELSNIAYHSEDGKWTNVPKIVNAKIVTEYIQLSRDELEYFKSESHEYITDRVEYNSTSSMESSVYVKNPIKMMVLNTVNPAHVDPLVRDSNNYFNQERQWSNFGMGSKYILDNIKKAEMDNYNNFRERLVYLYDEYVGFFTIINNLSTNSTGIIHQLKERYLFTESIIPSEKIWDIYPSWSDIIHYLMPELNREQMLDICQMMSNIAVEMVNNYQLPELDYQKLLIRRPIKPVINSLLINGKNYQELSLIQTYLYAKSTPSIGVYIKSWVLEPLNLLDDGYQYTDKITVEYTSEIEPIIYHMMLVTDKLVFSR